MAAASNASGGGTAVTSVDNSALFDGATQYLNRTNGTPTSTVRWSFSFWFYRTDPNGGANQYLISDNDSYYWGALINSDNKFEVIWDAAGDKYDSVGLFRDIGWYHAVVATDTSQAVASNRIKVYINGEEIALVVAAGGVALNETTGIGTSGKQIQIGTLSASGPRLGHKGYIAELCFIDGTQSVPTDFGEFDSTGLYWTPKSSTVIKELTFGNNGFYLSNESDLSSNMTTFVDSGPTAHTITTGNNTTHSPLGHKVQNSVIYVDGTTDYISVAPSGHADFTFGTGDFCIEGWFNRIALSGTSSYSYICDFRYSGNNTDRPAIYMTNLNTLIYAVGSSTKITASTNAVVGTWFNVAIARSGSTTTMYLNGTSVGSFTDNTDYASGRPWFFEYPQSNAYGFKGYATELRISKGVPRHTGNFTPSTTAFVSDSNTSLLVHSDKFFGAANDDSGNYNSFTNNNTVTTVSTNTPTLLSNFWNPIAYTTTLAGATLSNGNRTVTTGSSQYSPVQAIMPLVSGKWYCEVVADATSAYNSHQIGITKGLTTASTHMLGYLSTDYGYYAPTGQYRNNNAWVTYGATYASGDVIGMAIDLDSATKTLIFYKNGAAQPTINISANVNDQPYFFAMDHWNAGSTSTMTLRASASDWTGTAPDGYSELTTAGIAAVTTRTASDTNKYFQTTLYEGNGTGQRVGAFQPFDSTFTVGNSAVFNTSNYLSRTPSSTGNAKTATFSRWVRRNINGQLQILFSAVVSGSQKFYIVLGTGNQFELYNYSSAYDFRILTTRTFVDLSQWTHFYVAIDTSESTTADRIKVYINGVQETSFDTADYPSLNFDMDFNTASVPNYLGYAEGPGGNIYSAETAWVDGTIYAPSYFGEVDTSTNRWVPKALTSITWGTNGFYQDYADSGNVGDDESGNGNDFTNNSSVVQSTDSPTTNFAVLDPTFCYATPTVGNLVMDGYTSYSSNVATLGLTSGKWYWEMTCGSTVGAPMMGVVPFDQKNKAQYPGQAANGIGWDGGNVYRNNSALISSYGSAMANGQVNAVMLDLDSTPQTITFRQANSQLATINLIVNTTWFPYFRNGGAADASNATLNFGASSFTYTPPTGFIALSQDNLAGTDQFISAFSWIKNRDATDNHMLFDRVRGATNYLQSSANIVNTVNVNTVQRFLEAGVQVGNDVQVNTASESYVLWNFMTQATGSGTSNTSGDITTTCLVDTTLGMSVGTYTGSGVSGNTVGTGLDDCKIFIVKRMSNATNWPVTFPDILTDDYQVYLDSTGAQGAGGFFDTSANTGGQIGLTNHYSSNASTQPYFFLAFNSSQFISIGSFEGNGNANGAFAPMLNSLGVPIQPVFFFSKNIDASNNWDVRDIIRSPYNPSTNNLQPSTSSAEVNGTDYVDIITGGLKLRTSSANLNGSNKTIAYVAIGTPIIDTDGRIIAGR